LELVFAYLVRAEGQAATEVTLARAFARTRVLSADTVPALNANWPEVHEAQHAPILGKGVTLVPYTGHNGKQGGSAASPELIREVVDAFRRNGIPVQYGLLGRVDEGGGGTVAKYLAQRGCDVVDIGVAAVSIHSPMELTAKVDLWSAYRGFRAWLTE
jgi:aspartyl aminopeptidase